MDLYLTPAERASATFLSEPWTNECVVQEETMAFADTDKLLQVRRSVAAFEDPRLKKMQKATTKNQHDLAKEVEAMDMSALSDADVSQFFFVLGPTFLSGVIATQIMATKTPEDLQALCDLTQVRHGLLDIFTKPL